LLERLKEVEGKKGEPILIGVERQTLC